MKILNSVFTIMIMALLAFSFTGCGSFKKKGNGIKLKVSDVVANAAKKYSKKAILEHEEYSLPGYKEVCNSRAEMESELLKTDVRKKVDDLLKAQRSVSSESAAMKSLGSMAAKLACELALGNLVPKILHRKYEQYKCLLMVVGDNAKEKICKLIKT